MASKKIKNICAYLKKRSGKRFIGFRGSITIKGRKLYAWRDYGIKGFPIWA